MTATLTVDGIHSLMLKAGHRMPPRWSWPCMASRAPARTRSG
jgi:hypothetical protein